MHNQEKVLSAPATVSHCYSVSVNATVPLQCSVAATVFPLQSCVAATVFCYSVPVAATVSVAATVFPLQSCSLLQFRYSDSLQSYSDFAIGSRYSDLLQ
ncbi:hypothetical protein Q3G72_000166 [Acer saccharum]|nr:hypothetical protein Q3G72_000166 [Acer saccharum]